MIYYCRIAIRTCTSTFHVFSPHVNKYSRVHSDFHVPDVKVDPLKSKSIPHSLMKEERDFDKSMDDENEDRDEFVHEDWEDRIETESDGNAQTPPATRTNCLLKPGVSKKSLESSSGRTYPQDLWFLLGNYIHPESVQAFGCLCHGSWTVLKTFKFWAALYERTHKECKRNSPSEELEHRLKVIFMLWCT